MTIISSPRDLPQLDEFIEYEELHPETNEVLGYVDKVNTVINKTKLFLND